MTRHLFPSTRRWITAMIVAGAIVAAEPTCTVAVAASCEPAMRAVLPSEVAVVAGSSALLVRQLEQGADYQVLLLADGQWLDRLQQAQRIDPHTRVTVAGNRLVVAVRRASTLTAVEGAFAGRWTTADPASVPLGQYAQQALTSAGWWHDAEPRLIAAADARAAVRLVQRGEVDAGVLYASDVGDDLRVLHGFAADQHRPIRYEVAAVLPVTPVAKQVIARLISADGQAVLRAHGFQPAPTTTDPAP